MKALFLLGAVVAGVIAPRHRPVALLVASLLAPLVLLGWLLWFGSVPLVAGAALLAVAPLLALLVARALPRTVLFALAFVALPGVGAGLEKGLPPAALGAGVIALSALLVWKLDPGMRIVCALLGARLATFAIQGAVPLWQRLALAAAFFLIASVWKRDPALQLAPGARRVAAAGALVGLVLAGGVVAAWVLAPVVAQTRGVSPGLVWAAPSEAIIWDEPGIDRTLFPWFDNLDAVWLGAPARAVVRVAGDKPLIGLHAQIARLREIKSPQELELLRQAQQAIIESVEAVRPLVRAGTPEAEIAAAILAEARKRGCAPESFPPIVASGASAAHPHGTGNLGKLAAGTLVMIDAGCQVQHYASDYTRTFAVDGKPTERQQKLLDAVAAAQEAGARVCKPGASMKDIDKAARDAIKSRGLEDHNPFGIGHTVGLFVHDVQKRRELAPGMVITIEPGIYLEGELGIRLEDEYVVTATGCDRLTDR